MCFAICQFASFITYDMTHGNGAGPFAKHNETWSVKKKILKVACHFFLNEFIIGNCRTSEVYYGWARWKTGTFLDVYF